MHKIPTNKFLLGLPLRVSSEHSAFPPENSGTQEGPDAGNEPAEPMLPPARVNGVTHPDADPARHCDRHDSESHFFAILYEQATGEAPHDVLVLKRAVLVETGVAGSYEDFPNGYVPILISRTAEGWLVSDTGQSPSALCMDMGRVQSAAGVLYIRCGETLDELRDSVGTLVRALAKLH